MHAICFLNETETYNFESNFCLKKHAVRLTIHATVQKVSVLCRYTRVSVLTKNPTYSYILVFKSIKYTMISWKNENRKPEILIRSLLSVGVLEP